MPISDGLERGSAAWLSSGLSNAVVSHGRAGALSLGMLDLRFSVNSQHALAEFSHSSSTVGVVSGDQPDQESSARVLVVDDEESLVEMVASALRYGGFEVATATSGADALSAVRTLAVDLVVLDVNLGDMDGFEVCDQLRRDGHQIPVIFLTARDQPEDLRSGFRRGGDDYLTKPFSLEELGLRIEALLRRSRAAHAEGARIVVDRLVLDEDAHAVSWDGRDVDLSPTEFRLLRYLMLNEARVVSKMQILDYVWEYDFEGDARIVETYISYLRKKLGSEAAELIRTVRGVGYVLRPPA